MTSMEDHLGEREGQNQQDMLTYIVKPDSVYMQCFMGVVKWIALEGEKMNKRRRRRSRTWKITSSGEREGHNQQVALHVFHGRARFCMQCLMGLVRWTDLEGEKMKKKRDIEDHLEEREGHNQQVAKQVLHGQTRFCMQCLWAV